MLRGENYDQRLTWPPFKHEPGSRIYLEKFFEEKLAMAENRKKRH